MSSIDTGKGERKIDEERLIDQIRRGDQAAFQMLVEHYGQHVFQTAYSVLKEPKEAEDAAQEVFLQVYKSLPDYRSQGFKTWITRIAVHKAIDAKRKLNRRREDQMAEGELIEHLPSAEEDVLGQLVRQEKKRLLERKMDSLPAQHKDILFQFYIQEKSYDQIAKEQDIAVKTVESRLYRARSWIRNHWKEEEWNE
ncbi:RNA polymerase sigma factor [Paenibacillus dokdonensis]|uniref:RNA polymerase sigma factor n=1 Tax=Paenibacillus dokdonensis TaxID=2567944 RepID=A0ABU6GU46_9BACL|nr:RNA polymerase sigma factor [Paenibacillus dokdonensis]MEC0243274.1 RNA polymerase sigma factor [Paenibacillus dokdonensis]